MLEDIRSRARWSPRRPWRLWEAERDRLLHRFVNEQLYPFSPYYRRLFDAQRIDPHSIRRVADLPSLPFTTKTDIAPTAEDPLRHLDLVLQPDADSIRRCGAKSMVLKLLLARLLYGEEKAHERVRLEYSPVLATFTTGRTALPTQFLYASLDFERLHAVGKRLVDVQGALPGERGLNVFPFAPHLAFWQVFAVGQAATMLFLHTGGGKVVGTAGNITALERMQPEMLMGVPGYVYHLLRKAAERGVRLAKLKRIALGAERVPAALKLRLADLCREMGRPAVSVQGVYGFTEARLAWAECPAPDHETSYGYHTYPDLEVFEAIDPDTGQSVGEGERGELVYTTLGGRGSCVLRYRTGDIAEGGIVCEPCPGCGRIVPRICGALSRRSDISEFQLTKIRGTLVDLNEFLPVMAAIEEVVEWQLVIKKHNDDPQELDELMLYIALPEGIDERPVAARIAHDLLQRVEVAPNRIEVMPLSQLETNLGLDTQLKETRIRDVRSGTRHATSQS